ncbi:MAG: hypothetical protein ACYTEQ_01050 [Planctomycetota bacterium]
MTTTERIICILLFAILLGLIVDNSCKIIKANDRIDRLKLVPIMVKDGKAQHVDELPTP